MEGRSALTGLVYPLVFLCLLLLVRLSEVEARSPDPNPGGTADSILSSNLGVAVAAAIAGAIVGGVLAGIVAWPQIRAARAQENIARDALKEARRQADTAEDALKEAKRQADTAEDALAEARRAAETTRREAQREAAVTYLRTVASSLEGMARLLSVKEVPRVDGHAFEFMIQSFETTLTPYLGDEARRHASRCQELAVEAQNADRLVGLWQVGDAASMPIVKDLQRYAGDLKGMATNISASRPTCRGPKTVA